VAQRVPGEVALHLDVEGEGPLVVLAHGFGGSARNWRAQLRALRDRFRMAAFDVRGHARSEAPDDPAAYAPERFAADFGRVLDHLGERSGVVGGLSMGAGIALRFALAEPGRVRGLVLAAFPPGARGRQPESADARPQAAEGGAQRAEGERSSSDWALAFADAIERDGLEGAGARFAWGAESGLDAEAARFVRMGFLEHAPHAIAHTLRGLLAVQPSVEAMAPALARLDVPALVVVGGADRVSLRASQALARALPRARLEVVEGAGHVVNLAARERVNALLRQFLDSLAKPGGAHRLQWHGR